MEQDQNEHLKPWYDKKREVISFWPRPSEDPRDHLTEACAILAGESMMLPEVAHLKALADLVCYENENTKLAFEGEWLFGSAGRIRAEIHRNRVEAVISAIGGSAPRP